MTTVSLQQTLLAVPYTQFTVLIVYPKSIPFIDIHASRLTTDRILKVQTIQRMKALAPGKYCIHTLDDSLAVIELPPSPLIVRGVKLKTAKYTRSNPYIKSNDWLKERAHLEVPGHEVLLYDDFLREGILIALALI